MHSGSTPKGEGTHANLVQQHHIGLRRRIEIRARHDVPITDLEITGRRDLTDQRSVVCRCGSRQGSDPGVEIERWK